MPPSLPPCLPSPRAARAPHPAGSLLGAEVRVLHEVQLVDGVHLHAAGGVSVGVGVRVAVRGVGRGVRRRHLQVVERQRVGARLVERLEVGAVVEGDVRAAEALARVPGVSIWNRSKSARSDIGTTPETRPRHGDVIRTPRKCHDSRGQSDAFLENSFNSEFDPILFKHLPKRTLR